MSSRCTVADAPTNTDGCSSSGDSPEVFEHRHQLGDRRRPVAQEHTETPLAVDRIERTTERRHDVVGPRQHRLDVDEVADGGFGPHTRLVVGGHRRRRPPTRRDDLRPRRADRRAHPWPAHPRFARHCRSTRRAGPCHRAVRLERSSRSGRANWYPPASRGRGPRRRSTPTPSAATRSGQRRGEPRLRNVREHRGPWPDRLGEVEDPDDVSFLQSGDLRDQLGQLLDAGLEDHVTWQRLDHVADRTSGVALDGRADCDRPPRPARCPIPGIANTLWR